LGREIVLKKIILLATMLAMMMVAAAPAMAHEVQVGDNITTGDINTQFSQNVVGDISVSAAQSNTGDATAVDDSVAVIAQEQNVSVSVTQSSFQFLNTGVFFIH
jgi:hypothetical protein